MTKIKFWYRCLFSLRPANLLTYHFNLNAHDQDRLFRVLCNYNWLHVHDTGPQ